MRQILLNGKNWNKPDDIYDAFFEAVGAPSWHGRNFNAIHDSICTGGINEIEAPYCILVQNYSAIALDARRMADDFVALIKELRDSGCPVDIQVETSRNESAP
jgi:RNAse (barnase) inhibitor barstar